MGRPKGSKTQPQLDTSNIIHPKNTKNDENANPLPTTSDPPKKPKSTMDTRKKTKTDKVWHELVGSPIEWFPKTKLPQNRAVLRRFMALREKHPKEKLCILVNKIYEEMIVETWTPARIFTVSEMLCKIRIKTVIEKFLGFKHHTFSSGRDCPKKIAEMEEFLNQLCDLSPADLHRLLKNTAQLNKAWEEDWRFYPSMCEPKQVGRIAGADLKLAVKETVKETKKENEKKKEVKSGVEKRKREEVVKGDEFDDGAEAGDDDKDEDIVITQQKS